MKMKTLEELREELKDISKDMIIDFLHDRTYNRDLYKKIYENEKLKVKNLEFQLGRIKRFSNQNLTNDKIKQMEKRPCYKKDCKSNCVIEQFSMICPECETQIKKKAQKEIVNKILSDYFKSNQETDLIGLRIYLSEFQGVISNKHRK